MGDEFAKAGSTVKSYFPVTAPHSVPDTPAGKPMGFDTTDKTRRHIVFGDEKIGNGDRIASVTKAAYRPPVVESHHNEPSDVIRETIASRFHSKAEIASKSAHIGLQTRQDLPIDDNVFNDISTTAQDSFTKPCNFVRTVQLVAKPTNIQLGSQSTNYETSHKSSFTGHNVQYENKRHPIHVPFKLGHPQSDQYSTSFGTSYPRQDIQRPKTLVTETTKSCIPFGEDMQDRRKTQTSLTKRDFTYKVCEPTLPFIAGEHSGITKALMPTERNEYVSMTASAFRYSVINQAKHHSLTSLRMLLELFAAQTHCVPAK